MNREYALRTAWNVCCVKGLRPSRRAIQAEMDYMTGAKTSSNVIDGFLKKYQYETEDGLLRLHAPNYIGTNRQTSAQESLESCSIGTKSAQAVSTCADLTATVTSYNKNNDMSHEPEAQCSGQGLRPTLVSVPTHASATGEPSASKRDDRISLPSESEKKIPTPKAPAPKRKMAQQVMPEVVFESAGDERRVATLLALENKSGVLSESRRLSLRSIMRTKLDELGFSTWRKGVDVAIEKAMPWKYAVGVMRNSPVVPSQPSLLADVSVLDPEMQRCFVWYKPAVIRKGRYPLGWCQPGHVPVSESAIRAWMLEGIDMGGWPTHPDDPANIQVAA